VGRWPGLWSFSKSRPPVRNYLTIYMFLYLEKLNCIRNQEMLCETCVSSEDLGDVLVAAVEHGGVQE
jgi:hypothetical protein